MTIASIRRMTVGFSRRMTVGFSRRMNLGFLQRLNPGLAEGFDAAQLHVFHHGDGHDRQSAGMLLAGLQWSQPAPSGGSPAASGSQGAVTGNWLPGPATCVLQWRGSHVRIPSVTLRDVGRSLDESADRDNGTDRYAGSDRYAGTDVGGSSPADPDHASLLVQMCLAVEQEMEMGGNAAVGHADGEYTGSGLEGLWLFVAEVRSVSGGFPDGPGTRRWWLGATQDGRPSDMVPEELHDSLEDLVRALTGIAMTSPVACIALASGEPDGHASDGTMAGPDTSTSFDPGGSPAADRLVGALDAYGPEIPQPISVAPRALMNGDPVFRQLSQRKARITMSAAAGCAILAAGLAWQTGLFSVPSLPQRTISFTVPAHGAVRSACFDGLTDIWPRMPGWTTTAAGCARAGYLPKDIGAAAGDAGSVILWHAYDRDGDANAVLASVAGGELLKAHGQSPNHGHALPGSAAGVPLTAGDPPEVGVPANARRLVLWRQLAIRTRQTEPGGFEPMGQVERMLSQAFADVPGAVNTDRNTLTVTIPDPPHRALDRLATIGTPTAVGAPTADGAPAVILPQVDLVAVERRNDRTVLHLQPGRVQRPGNDGEAI